MKNITFHFNSGHKSKNIGNQKKLNLDYDSTKTKKLLSNLKTLLFKKSSNLSKVNFATELDVIKKSKSFGSLKEKVNQIIALGQ